MNRIRLLTKLNDVSVGLSKKESLEQSDCFIFSGKQVIAFNGEIMCRAKNPFDFDAIVPAKEFLKLLTLMNDNEIQITIEDNEIIVKGKNKKAGITCDVDLLLPYKEIPKPGEWSKVNENLNNILYQASLACGTDETMPMTTCVHATEDRIEACDNNRLYIAKISTGIPLEILIPAISLNNIKNYKLVAVSNVKEWLHFKTKSNCIISIRCYSGDYHKDTEKQFEMKGEKLELPDELIDILRRAEVMIEGASWETEVHLELKKNTLIIKSNKDGGWYEEKKRIKYSGKELAFSIQPELLIDILEKEKVVTVCEDRLKIKTGNVKFIVMLRV